MLSLAKFPPAHTCASNRKWPFVFFGFLFSSSSLTSFRIALQKYYIFQNTIQIRWKQLETASFTLYSIRKCILQFTLCQNCRSPCLPRFLVAVKMFSIFGSSQRVKRSRHKMGMSRREFALTNYSLSKQAQKENLSVLVAKVLAVNVFAVNCPLTLYY